LQVFHLLPSGQAVLGEPPPPPKSTTKERAPREGIEFDISALEGLGQKLKKLKLPDATTLGIVGGVLLLVAAGFWLFSRQSVETRTQLLATAITKGDMQTIVDLALPGTEMEALKWSVDIVKQYGDLKLSLGGQDPSMKVQVQSNNQGSAAQALVVFSREGARSAGTIPVEELQPVPNLASTKKSLDVMLFWTADTWRNWRLDAKRTAEAFKPSA
jgi:hypothetical protein